MSQPQYPQQTYNRFEIVQDTPNDDSNLPEAVPVQQPIIQGQQIPYIPQQNPYPQLPSAYYIPVQGPNGLVYMPVNNQNAPIQGQPFMPQQFQQAPYPYPQPQFQPQEPSYYERATTYFGSLTDTDKYRLRLRVFSVIAIIALIMTVRCMFKGNHGHGKILGLINIILTVVSLKRGICAIQKKSKRAYKGFLRMFGIVFILAVYNLIIFISMTGFRHMGGAFALLGFAAIAGCTLCKGKRLWKQTLKAEWAGLPDPCAGGWCCRNRGGQC